MPRDPRVLQKVDELVRLSVDGKYPESIAAGQEALRLVRVHLGPEHPDTAACLNLFGSLLHQFGDLAGARPYLEQALALRHKVLGPEHSDTSASLNNLVGHLP